MPTLYKTTLTPSADVATNATMTFAYPVVSGSALTSAGVITGSGAKMFSAGLQQMFTQGASNFSIAYGATIVVTYLGATTIPAGTPVDFFVPVGNYAVKSFQFPIDAQPKTAATTDSTGGTAADVAAAITNPAANATTSLTADVLAIKNALATLIAKQNAVLTILTNAGLMSAT
jgi:hypothetical protein